MSDFFNPATVRKIARLTQNNDVVGALVEGTKMLGLSELQQKVALVGKLQDLEGELPPGLSEYRYGLYQTMMRHAKQVLTAEEYNQFYKAF